ncbi:hypothetical protein [Rhizobium sp. Leaf453]|uniref:hypothetical protein n=1 Tax=unclassified Rhizobium TaxID=2613769 RepID=UPI0009E8C3D0|nr:hypothetical protein [Rhizobium sp. Leaf453]
MQRVYAKGLEHSDNNCVASAKPRVITGSDDATANKESPGEKPIGKDGRWRHSSRHDRRGRDHLPPHPPPRPGPQLR